MQDAMNLCHKVPQLGLKTSEFMRKKFGFLLVISVFYVTASGCEKDEPSAYISNNETAQGDTVFTETYSDTNSTIEEKDTIRFLALGDSYTIGESVTSFERWPNRLKTKLEDSLNIKVNTQIIAQTGWTTDELMAGINTASLPDTFDLVSLLIGVNNQYRGRPVTSFIPEYIQLLERAISYAQGDTSRVFAVSIPNYGYTPFGAPNQLEITQELLEYNRVSDSICNQYKIPFIEITDISERGLVQPQLVADDDLHPSGEQYRLWVNERIYPAVKHLID